MHAGLKIFLLSFFVFGSHSIQAQPQSQDAASLEAAGSPEVAVLASLDSLRRVITMRILSASDKKEIRACDREKTEFLKQCRTSEPTTGDVDRRLNDAKLGGANPNDPAIQALLEKKFQLEKACDDRFTATLRGKQCLAGGRKRQEALDKALAVDKEYQKLWKRSQAISSEPL